MKPLREHFEIDTDAGTTLRTFDYIDALEKYATSEHTKAWNAAIDKCIEKVAPYFLGKISNRIVVQELESLKK